MKRPLIMAFATALTMATPAFAQSSGETSNTAGHTWNSPEGQSGMPGQTQGSHAATSSAPADDTHAKHHKKHHKKNSGDMNDNSSSAANSSGDKSNDPNATSSSNSNPR